MKPTITVCSSIIEVRLASALMIPWQDVTHKKRIKQLRLYWPHRLPVNTIVECLKMFFMFKVSAESDPQACCAATISA
eukprot:m.130768 g.130768  ORF g.130768 m.130768 type:complete len:78 (+) comp14608_c0_seq4:421-654(+)